MKFRFYFFKDGNRVYDKADLFEFLNNLDNVTVDLNRTEKVAHYYNPVLDFEADIIIGEKSVVPNLHNLSANFLDLNVRLEIDLLLPSYKLDKVLDIIEIICKRYQFLVYNETYEDVRPFRRATMIKAYELIKQAYKEKNEEEFMNYNKLERNLLDQVYIYNENKDKLIEGTKHLEALEYQFYKRPGGRTAYVGVKWNGEKPFIIPSNVALFIFDDGEDSLIISYKELFSKIEKFVRPVDTSIFGIYECNPKYIKKIRKVILKTKFTKLQADLIEVKLNTILDL